MRNQDRTWAVVLAAGEGRRLQSITVDERGEVVPKQFCSLDGGESLIQETMRRAGRIAGAARTVCVVAAEHRRWWERDLASFPRSRVVVQPNNRGTAAGILLPLIHLAGLDPDARVVFFPSDHYIDDEAMLAERIRRAVAELRRKPDSIILLGMSPDRPDPELGWILPGEEAGVGLHRVVSFVEKPRVEVAGDLLLRGGLWNSFIFAGTVRTLVDLYRRRLPRLLEAFERASAGGREAWTELYRDLETLDFSRELFQGSEASLRVLRVPCSGWSDLGTPDRITRCLQLRDIEAGAPMAAGKRGAGSAGRIALLQACAPAWWGRGEGLLSGAA